MAKAAHWTITDADARKLGEQTGLDTLVVLALNDDCLVWQVPNPAVPKLTRKELTGARTSGGACGLIRRNAKNLTWARNVVESGRNVGV